MKVLKEDQAVRKLIIGFPQDRKHGWEGMNCLWKIAGLMEDLFLGSQWSIILGYRRLSVKSLLAFSS